MIKKKKPLLTVNHRRQRLDFARRYKEWTVEDWKRVIWSDETKINRFQSDGLRWAWKRDSDPAGVLANCEIQSTVKHWGGGV